MCHFSLVTWYVTTSQYLLPCETIVSKWKSSWKEKVISNQDPSWLVMTRLFLSLFTLTQLPSQSLVNEKWNKYLISNYFGTNGFLKINKPEIITKSKQTKSIFSFLEVRRTFLVQLHFLILKALLQCVYIYANHILQPRVPLSIWNVLYLLFLCILYCYVQYTK